MNTLYLIMSISKCSETLYSLKYLPCQRRNIPPQVPKIQDSTKILKIFNELQCPKLGKYHFSEVEHVVCLYSVLFNLCIVFSNRILVATFKIQREPTIKSRNPTRLKLSKMSKQNHYLNNLSVVWIHSGRLICQMCFLDLTLQN